MIIKLLNLGERQDSVLQLQEQIQRQQQTGYRLAYSVDESNGETICVAGFVIQEKLAWGRHMYVDDLVTSENARNTGAGTQMITWLTDYGRQHGCGELHLDSGVQRFAAHRFYLREGFEIRSHHFMKVL